MLNVIFAKYSKDLSFIHKTEDTSINDFKKNYVLKPRGRDEYLLMQKVRLLEVECIHELSINIHLDARFDFVKILII